MVDYVKVPKSELVKLEESRKMLYEFAEKHTNLKGSGSPNFILCELLNITEQIWKVANTKNWYHLDATNPLTEESNSSVKELDLKIKINTFGNKDVSKSELLKILHIPEILHTDDLNVYYKILDIEILNNDN